VQKKEAFEKKKKRSRGFELSIWVLLPTQPISLALPKSSWPFEKKKRAHTPFLRGMFINSLQKFMFERKMFI